MLERVLCIITDLHAQKQRTFAYIKEQLSNVLLCTGE